MRLFLIFIATMTICLSCEKETGSGGETVEIYELKTIQTVAGKCQIDPALSVIQNSPTINNRDILEYWKTTYEFKLSDAGFEKVKSFKDRTAFAVTVDKKVIYYGFFKPSYSSSSCDNYNLHRDESHTFFFFSSTWSLFNSSSLRLLAG